MIRLTSSLWVSAYLRTTVGEGCYSSVVRHGAESAGAIFVIVNHIDGAFSLFGPAPQSAFFETNDTDRQFCELIVRQPERTILDRLQREQNFDPDLWIIENENRAGRSFLTLVKDN